MHAARMFARFIKPHIWWAILSPLAMALEVTMDLLQPRLLQHIIDQGIARGSMATVLHMGGLMIGAALVGMAGGVGCTILSVLAAQGLGTDLRHTLFAKVQTLSFGNLDRLETGGLITRLTSDVMQVQDASMMLLRIMVRAPLMLVGGLIMGLVTSPRLSLLFIPLMPAVLGVLIVVVRKTYPMFSKVQERLDALNGVLQENLAGIRVVKAFGRARHEAERFGAANEALVQQNIVTLRVNAITMPAVIIILNLGVVGALWLGGQGVVRGSLHVGEIVAFTNYLMQVLFSLMFVSMLVMRLARAEASAQRIDEVLESVPDVPNPEAPKPMPEPRGRVQFDNVTFSYSRDGSDPVLKGVSFVAEPGQRVALLGATGSGKSSLVNLTPRFYDISEGRITLDGADIRELDQTELHSAIGVALQETVLFSGTIRDNIRYGKPDASDEEVVEAAKLAQAHDFITGFPEGYDTVLGQRGVNLSGGQKQRIAIARALLPNPPVLILDDSTSAVDVETEARIQAAMEKRDGKGTVLVVAQRIGTVVGADRILVIDDGRIVAQGAHAELMESSPIYRDIYESQIGGGEVEDDAS